MLKSIKQTVGQIPLKLLHRGYPKLAELFQRVALKASENPVRRRLLYFIQSSGRLYTMRKLLRDAAVETNTRDYPVIVITRDCDTVRLEAFQKKADQFHVRFVKSHGVDCTDESFDFTPYENKISRTFHNQTRILKGGLGCFLGHAEAWKLFDSYKHSEIALICEDDARILGPLPMKSKDMDLPLDADLIFANQRMGEGLLKDEYLEKLRSHYYLKVPLNAALVELMGINNPISGPGGDGYILTRKGVEKLLRIYSGIKVDVDVDWFLLCHSLTDREISDFMAKDGTGRFDSMSVSTERLISYVLLPILVEQAPMGSSRRAEDPNAYLEISKMFNK